MIEDVSFLFGVYTTFALYTLKLCYWVHKDLELQHFYIDCHLYHC